MISAALNAWMHLQAAWPNISLVLGLLWLLYVVLLSAWILLQKREPIATLSWLLSLILLPYIGFLIYHFLGPTRIKRQNLKRSKARAGLMPLTDANLLRSFISIPLLTLKVTAAIHLHALKLWWKGLKLNRRPTAPNHTVDYLPEAHSQP